MIRKLNVGEYVIYDKGVVVVSKILQNGKIEITWTETHPDYVGHSDFIFHKIINQYEVKRWNKPNFIKAFYKDLVNEMDSDQAKIEIDSMFAY